MENALAKVPKEKTKDERVPTQAHKPTRAE